MSKFLYPVDTDQFEDIRKDGKVYVDKTDMVFDLVSKYRYVFLARPRRFGKSLLCNTFKAYFQGQKELFEACPEQGRRGLKIAELEKEWKAYPVLHFVMSGLKNCTISEAKSALELFISDYEKIYGRNPAEETPGKRFRGLIHRAYEQTGEKVIVIFDEYDSPILRVMYETEELDSMRNMLREFYQVLKDEGAYLRFVFITGVTKFSQLSIFSELNNLKQISMLDDYSGICGITQDELDTMLRPNVMEYAESLNITTEEAYALLKRNYDGYHFSENSKDVYAPFSLLNALNDNQTKQYWFESGTMTSLIEHLKHYPAFNPLDFDGAELSLEDFNAPCEKAETPIPLLYQSGYLTIESYNKEDEVYNLHFPNYEVRQGMLKGLTKYLMDIDSLEQNASILAMARAVKRGDLPAALTELRSYIASIPYDIITKKEWMRKKKRESFYKMLLYVVFSLLNSKVDTEVKSILGRADVVIRTKTHIFVLKLMLDKDVDDALAQIDDKGYAIPYETYSQPKEEAGRDCTGSLKVFKCGISISSEVRNIVHWKILDEARNIVDEQKF